MKNLFLKGMGIMFFALAVSSVFIFHQKEKQKTIVTGSPENTAGGTSSSSVNENNNASSGAGSVQHLNIFEKEYKNSIAKRESRNLPASVLNRQIPEEVFEVKPGDATELYAATGSIISIPENAFRYADGSPVNETVHLMFREFHDPESIIAEDLPMSFEGKIMESAGMFELKGKTKSGREVIIDKPLEVKLISEKKGEDFIDWYLDESPKNKTAHTGTFISAALAAPDRAKWTAVRKSATPVTEGTQSSPEEQKLRKAAAEDMRIELAEELEKLKAQYRKARKNVRNLSGNK